MYSYDQTAIPFVSDGDVYGNLPAMALQRITPTVAIELGTAP